MILHNDFLGTDYFNCSMDFIPNEDDVEKFIDNLNEQPEDWHYRNSLITYQFNENGHRSKSLDKLNLDNYILYVGCSHTVGVGVKLEETFPYIASQYVWKGADYYNLAVSGAGIDTLEYNLLTWFTKIKKKPKLVVIQWPDHSRFIVNEPGRREFVPSGTWTSNFDAQKFIYNSEVTGAVHGRKAINVKLIETLIDVPKLTLIHEGLVPYDSNSIVFRTVDRARDLKHSGIQSHRLVAEKIIESYYKIYKNYIEYL
jgi:hypothetical protein